MSLMVPAASSFGRG